MNDNVSYVDTWCPRCCKSTLRIDKMTQCQLAGETHCTHPTPRQKSWETKTDGEAAKEAHVDGKAGLQT